MKTVHGLILKVKSKKLKMKNKNLNTGFMNKKPAKLLNHLKKRLV